MRTTYALCSSGGKDSMLALDRAQRQGYQVAHLVTLYDAPSRRVRFHGVPIALLHAQAAALGLESRCYGTTPDTFELVFLRALDDLRTAGVHGVIFGNIHLADVRAWYEDRVRAAGLEHVEPLWGEQPAALIAESLARGYRAIITCIEEARADPAWLGHELSATLVAAFAARGIDVCGERGEYHTLVTDGPLFQAPLAVRLGPEHREQGFRQVEVRLLAPAQEPG